MDALKLLDEVRSALAEHYEVEREIGAGGMASVYLATDLRHHRQVAIKVLLPTQTLARGTDRFQQEIRLAAGLTHPHILPVLDSGTFEAEGPRIWYSSPYVEGESLRDKLTNGGPLPVESSLRVVTEIAEALDYAHRQGVIHRDVKPDNILLSDGQAFLADFGVAFQSGPISDDRLTEAGMAIGTPRYMSPEQATGSEGVDHRTDIYALGGVLYESLTGAAPFDGTTPMAIVAQALTEDPPAVSKLRPAAATFDQVVATALSRIPGDRYQSAGEMATALRAAAAPVVSAPSLARSVGLRRPLAALGAIVVVAGLAFAATQRIEPSGPAEPVEEASIAVLPFRAIGEGAQETVEGITLATRDRLAVVDGIVVVGAASSAVERFRTMAATEVAQELGTDFILTATVEQNSATGSIEVRPSLVGSTGGRIDLWNDGPIVAPVDEPGRAELTIASDVARALDLTIGAAARASLSEPGRSSVAYALYLRGLGQRGARRTARLQEALAVDSTFALAREPLAAAAMNRYLTTQSAQDSAALLGQAEAMIRHAPRYYGGYLHLGLYHRTVTLEYDSAIAYLDRARSLAPGDANIGLHRASALWSAGLLDEALVEARRGAGLDPLSPSATSRVSRILLWQHRLDEARSRQDETLGGGMENIPAFVMTDRPLLFAALGMPDSAQAFVSAIPLAGRRDGTAAFINDITWQGWLVNPDLLEAVCADQDGAIGSGFAFVVFHRQMGCAITAWIRGDTTRAQATADSVIASLEPRASAGTRDRRVHMALAYAYFFAGDREESVRRADTARALLPAYWDYYPGAFNAVVYAQLAGLMGDADRAVEQLQLMVNGSSPVTPAWLRVDPSFAQVRDDTRFRALLIDR